MTRTQIQLSDELYQRAKRFAAQRTFIGGDDPPGLELFLERYPEEEQQGKAWKLPKVNGGGIKVPLEQLHDLATDDRAGRARKAK